MNPDQDLLSLLICKHLLGTLTAEEQQTLDQWRRENSYNEAAFQRLCDRDRLLVEHHRARLLADYSRPLAATRQRIGQDKAAIRPLWRRYVAAAAVALLLLGGAYLAYDRLNSTADTALLADTGDADAPRPGTTQAVLTLSDGHSVQLGSSGVRNSRAIAEARRDQRSHTKEPERQVLTTPRGGEFRIELEDGSEVWLNAQSRLVYPETFDGPERRVELEGEAYFRVAKNTERPFYVVSAGQEVRVYGTEFNVNAYADEGKIYTTLVSGSIALRPVDGQRGELMLTPGRQAVFDKSDASATVRPVDVEMATCWRHGTFVFDNQTMAQIMRTLSRWYDFDYEFADPQAAQTVFMGSIPRYGSFAEVTDIFHRLGGIRVEQDGRHVVIRTI